MRKKVDTLIVDLDNTLFDWLAFWHESFIIIYQEIGAALGKEEAESAIRRVHQNRRTSEYRFLVDELLDCRVPEANRIRARIERLSARLQRRPEPYQGVRESLAAIKSAGTKVVVCTESMEIYSMERLAALRLGALIDDVFCTESHPLPAKWTASVVPKFKQLAESASVHHIGKGLSKPDPRILRELLNVIGAEAGRTAYVGDSISRDVAMATRVGVTDIYAKYGTTQGRPEVELLRRVSHWTDADIFRESEALSNVGHIQPSITLSSGFSEIFDFVQFERFKRTVVASK